MTPAEDLRRETIAGEGWHRDPFDLAGERWWDGMRWTVSVRGTPLGGAEAAAVQGGETAAESLRGMPPGWYPWRGEVARWWDGEKWGPARRPFADHLEPTGPKRLRPRSLVRWRYAPVLVLIVAGVVLWITLLTGSSATGYQTRVGRLCRQTFAREGADILRESTTAVSARTSHSRAVVLGRLLRALAQESAVFDEKLQAITPPPRARAAQEQLLSLQRQDIAIYARAIPPLEGRSGLRALNPDTSLLSRNAETIQRLLRQLGGPPCSTSPLGLS
jgi:hypothetical protein